MAIHSSVLACRIPQRREWQPTPVFWPGDSHGHRSLAGYSPWGPQESEATLLQTQWMWVFNPWVRKIPWNNGNPLQCSRLKNSIDREAWWATVHAVMKSQTQLSTHTTIVLWTNISIEPWLRNGVVGILLLSNNVNSTPALILIGPTCVTCSLLNQSAGLKH